MTGTSIPSSRPTAMSSVMSRCELPVITYSPREEELPSPVGWDKEPWEQECPE